MPLTNRRHANAVGEQRCPDIRTAFDEASQGHGWADSSRRVILVSLMRTEDWHPWLADSLHLLSSAESGRVQRMRFQADRDALALAYALHRLLLGEMLGLDPQDVPLDRDALGRPQLAGDVAHTSLSHAAGLIAVAMTGSGPVGIDIEPANRASAMAEIAGAVCHPVELVALRALDDPDRNAALLALWVRKEALLKAAGVGLAVPMDTFVAPAGQPLLRPIAGNTTFRVRMLERAGPCVAAVAGLPETSIDCHWLRPVGAPPASDTAYGSRTRPVV